MIHGIAALERQRITGRLGGEFELVAAALEGADKSPGGIERCLQQELFIAKANRADEVICVVLPELQFQTIAGVGGRSGRFRTERGGCECNGADEAENTHDFSFRELDGTSIATSAATV